MYLSTGSDDLDVVHVIDVFEVKRGWEEISKINPENVLDKLFRETLPKSSITISGTLPLISWVTKSNTAILH